MTPIEMSEAGGTIAVVRNRSSRPKPARQAGTGRVAARLDPAAEARADGGAWRGPAIVFAVALVLRLLHLYAIQRAPFGDLLMGDPQAYDAWARRIASGDWLGQDVFYQAPVYPYFLGAIYSLLGRDFSAVRICQAIVGSASCALLTLAGRRFFDTRAGLAAGLLLAVYGPALFFDALLQKAVLDAFFLSLLLLAVAAIDSPPPPGRAALAGAALGGFVLTRENAIVLFPVLLLWLFLRGGKRWAPAAALGLGFALAVSPVTLRNLAVGGELHLTTAQSGPNFYIGNHEGATGTYVALRPHRGSATYERQDATELAEAALGRSLGPGEVSRYWRDRAIDWISTHPGAWLRLIARKSALVWNAVELADTEDLYTHGERSFLLRSAAALFHFGVLAPLALLGIWLTRARWRELWVLYAICAAYAASVVLFYVLDRYRYPLVPPLMLFAGAAIAQLPAWWRRSGSIEKWRAAAIAAIAALACNWPLVATRPMRGLTHYNIAYAMQTGGRNDEAIAKYREALRSVPRHAGAHSNLGALLAARGDRVEALAHYRRAIEIEPRLPEAHVNLGIELAAAGRPSEAIAAFGRALDLDPRSARAHYNLGLVLTSTGPLSQAAHHFTEAIRIEPSNAEAHNNLGIVLATQGRLDDAIEHFRTATRLRPDLAGARQNLEKAEKLSRRE